MFLKMFLEHPASVGETYLQHLWHASGFGMRMLACGAACLVHALIPCLFVSTGSRALTSLHDRMVTNRARILTQHRRGA